MRLQCLKTNIIVILLVTFSLNSNLYAQENDAISVVPIPTEYEVGEGYFKIDRSTTIFIESSSAEIKKIVEKFKSDFRTVSGMMIPIKDISQWEETINNAIVIKLGGKDLGKEGYALNVNTDNVFIKAPKPAGIFYAIQSLKQLLPPEIEKGEIARAVSWQIPAVSIKDKPKYKWRGLHLDVGRHLSSIDFIKEYLDNMAMHKLNTFHWHLTEDQGWRIEIKKYPKLTQVGAYRDSTLVGHYGTDTYDSKPYGGYYTQEEVKEIVAYAKERYITVVPEIEMPGHSTAAIAAYPELGVYNQNIRPSTTWGIFPDIYNVEESTFTFLENVLDEVIELFPSKYIHIGGDEAPKEQWNASEDVQAKLKELGLKDTHELQSYFITRIEKYLNNKGRSIIGWDEILEGGLAPNAAVMSWRGEEGGIAAAKSGHYVVMTPGSHLYLDHYQGQPSQEPLAIGGYTTLEKTYSYDPTPDTLSIEESKFVMGAQGNVWTEYLPTSDHIEYMVFPRVSALSEVVWSGEENKNWDSFKKRIPELLERYSYRDINFAKSIYNVEFKEEKVDASRVKVTLENQLGLDTIYYTTDGAYPLPASKKYTAPIEVNKGTVIKAAVYKDDNLIGNITEITVGDGEEK